MEVSQVGWDRLLIVWVDGNTVDSGRADISRVVWAVEAPCGHLSSLDMDDQLHAQLRQ